MRKALTRNIILEKVKLCVLRFEPYPIRVTSFVLGYLLKKLSKPVNIRGEASKPSFSLFYQALRCSTLYNMNICIQALSNIVTIAKLSNTSLFFYHVSKTLVTNLKGHQARFVKFLSLHHRIECDSSTMTTLALCFTISYKMSLSSAFVHFGSVVKSHNNNFLRLVLTSRPSDISTMLTDKAAPTRIQILQKCTVHRRIKVMNVHFITDFTAMHNTLDRSYFQELSHG